jgi:hypothetical protein
MKKPIELNELIFKHDKGPVKNSRSIDVFIGETWIGCAIHTRDKVKGKLVHIYGGGSPFLGLPFSRMRGESVVRHRFEQAYKLMLEVIIKKGK